MGSAAVMTQQQNESTGRAAVRMDGWSGGNLGNAHGGVWIQRGGLEKVPHAVLERGANWTELGNEWAEQAGVRENAVGWL